MLEARVPVDGDLVDSLLEKTRIRPVLRWIGLRPVPPPVRKTASVQATGWFYLAIREKVQDFRAGHAWQQLRKIEQPDSRAVY